MISFSKLGSRECGRLGNNLWQIASTIGIAEHFGVGADFPEWKYSQYFANALPYETGYAPHVKEKHFHYDLSQFSEHCDIEGWLQSEKYFEHCKEKVKEQLRFNFDFKKQLAIKHQYYARPTIAISIRRGDYVNNPTYALLPETYYIGALLKHFPDFENYNIVIFSDDMVYSRAHFECLPNIFFAEGTDIEQLCLMSMCDNCIISNSTFSWWGAWLSGGKVIRPNYHFGYYYGKVNSAKDYYPARWITYDHEN